jgi:hypothetical protein
MKKLCLVVAALLVVAAPALADVTLTCTQAPGTMKVTVNYAVTDPNKVRAFALDITVDNGAKIIEVNDLNANYWVYPGSIVIINGEVNDVGTPVANPYDPCTLPGQTQLGLNSSGVTIEMGSLYSPPRDGDQNAPPWNGTLLTFKVDKDCCVTFAENTVRGGVVLTTVAHPTVIAPGIGATPCFPVQPPYPPVPCPIDYPASDPDGAYTITWTASAGATSYQLESSAPAAGTTIYPLWVQVYSGTATTFNEKVGGGTWQYRVKACNANGCSDWCTGTDCVVSECLKSTATEYAAWKIWRYPRCWCFKRQCRGDINGLKVGVNWVQSADLACFKLAYLKGAGALAPIICSSSTTGTIRGICADLNHAAVGLNRVQSADLAIFKTYYLKGEAIVTCCDTAAPAADCVLVSGDKYNFWTN